MFKYVRDKFLDMHKIMKKMYVSEKSYYSVRKKGRIDNNIHNRGQVCVFTWNGNIFRRVVGK